MKYRKFLGVLDCFKIVSEIVILVFIIILCSLSSKDPFKSDIIGNMTNYFNINPNTYSIEGICICNNITYDHSCTEKNIVQGCLRINSDIIDFKPLITRKLASSSFCSDLMESFERNEGKKLSFIFDLNYQAIRKLSIALLIVDLSFIILTVVRLILIIKDCYRCPKIILFFVWFFRLIADIGKFVLSLILLHFIESGDIEKYDDFLDCRIVKEKYFEKFSDINKIRRCFLGFAVINIISESIDKLKDLFEDCVIYDKKGPFSNDSISSD